MSILGTLSCLGTLSVLGTLSILGTLSWSHGLARPSWMPRMIWPLNLFFAQCRPAFSWSRNVIFLCTCIIFSLLYVVGRWFFILQHRLTSHGFFPLCCWLSSHGNKWPAGMFLGFFPSTLLKFTGVNLYFPHLHHKLVPPFLLPLVVAARWAYLHGKESVLTSSLMRRKGWSTHQSAYVDSISFSWASCQCHLWCILSFADFVFGWVRIRAQSWSSHGLSDSAQLLFDHSCYHISVIFLVLFPWPISWLPLASPCNCHTCLLVALSLTLCSWGISFVLYSDVLPNIVLSSLSP